MNCSPTGRQCPCEDGARGRKQKSSTAARRLGLKAPITRKSGAEEGCSRGRLRDEYFGSIFNQAVYLIQGQHTLIIHFRSH